MHLMLRNLRTNKLNFTRKERGKNETFYTKGCKVLYSYEKKLTQIFKHIKSQGAMCKRKKIEQSDLFSKCYATKKLYYELVPGL